MRLYIVYQTDSLGEWAAYPQGHCGSWGLEEGKILGSYAVRLPRDFREVERSGSLQRALNGVTLRALTRYEFGIWRAEARSEGRWPLPSSLPSPGPLGRGERGENVFRGTGLGARDPQPGFPKTPDQGPCFKPLSVQPGL